MRGWIYTYGRTAVLGLLLASVLGGCGYNRYLSGSPAVIDKSRTYASTRPAATVAVADNPSLYYDNLSYHHVTVLPGDTYTRIADRHGVPTQSVLALNRARAPYTIYVGQQVKIPAFKGHRVQPGETLYAISRVYNVEMGEIAHFNRMNPPYQIGVGSVLRIPDRQRREIRVASMGDKAWPVADVQPRQESRSVSSAATSRAVTSASLAAPSGASAPATSAATTAPQRQAIGAGTGQSAAPTPKTDKPVRVASLGPVSGSGLVNRTAPEPQTPRRSPEEVMGGTAIPKADLPPVPRERYSIKRPPSREGSRFIWPVSGKVVSGFGKKSNGFHNDGINILAKAGDPVRAAENGIVSYVGNEMRSFGNLILISHADGYVTTYGHNARILVQKGDRVSKGDIIAHAGATGDVDTPQVHFEVRKQGKAINPATMLARR
ncbi:peptidoglycan DD-metalloendopeptidase family protein [Sneathiella chinensis]|uniref:Peptidase M23 n=1 Tax=Sneathiella chinensis TaxID=349750 RepID=A0ABQ5U819_9PROT|nr:peptidoglycan DD-metalloendopeptidase family protein [Sneathiella chinensis]GLQ07467.1 peptidase M23 [Sneathiella chinensis]